MCFFLRTKKLENLGFSVSKLEAEKVEIAGLDVGWHERIELAWYLSDSDLLGCLDVWK